MRYRKRYWNKLQSKAVLGFVAKGKPINMWLIRERLHSYTRKPSFLFNEEKGKYEYVDLEPLDIYSLVSEMAKSVDDLRVAVWDCRRVAKTLYEEGKNYGI